MNDFYLLNLDRTPERLHEFYAENPQYQNITRLPAKDGQTLNIELLIAQKKIIPPLNYSFGAIGAAFSHISFWENVIKNGSPATIFEDDAIINHKFKEISLKIIRQASNDWDLILWGFNTDAFLSYVPTPLPSLCITRFDHKNIIDNRLAYRDSDIDIRLFRLFRAHGIVSYSISPNGARKLLDYCTPLRSMQTFYPGLERFKENTGIDDMMANCYEKIEAYVSFPPLVLAKNDLKKSTIQMQP